eukprot:m51a1_g5960 hypothetical protein (499) ;mRNA; r:162085-164166
MSNAAPAVPQGAEAPSADVENSAATSATTPPAPEALPSPQPPTPPGPPTATPLEDDAPHSDAVPSSDTEDDEPESKNITSEDPRFANDDPNQTAHPLVLTPKDGPVTVKYMLPADYVEKWRWEERCFSAGTITPKIQALRPQWKVGAVIKQQLKNHDSFWMIRAEREAHYHALILLQWVMPPDAITSSRPGEYSIGNLFAVKRVSDMKDFAVDPVPGVTEGRLFSVDFGAYREDLDRIGICLGEDPWSPTVYSAARESGKPWTLPPLLVSMAKDYTTRNGTQYRRRGSGSTSGPSGIPRASRGGPKAKRRTSIPSTTPPLSSPQPAIGLLPALSPPPASIDGPQSKRARREASEAAAQALAAAVSDDEYSPEPLAKRRSRRQGQSPALGLDLTPQPSTTPPPGTSMPLPRRSSVSPAVAPVHSPMFGTIMPPAELRGEKLIMPWLRGQLAGAGEDAYEAALRYAAVWQQAHSHSLLMPIMKDFDELLALVAGTTPAPK